MTVGGAQQCVRALVVASALICAGTHIQVTIIAVPTYAYEENAHHGQRRVVSGGMELFLVYTQFCQ